MTKPIDVEQKMAEELVRLRSVTDRAAKAWLSLEPPVAWEGCIGAAMEAAVGEIGRLRDDLRTMVGDEQEAWEQSIRSDVVRAGLDPRGCVGMAHVHMLVEEIERLRRSEIPPSAPVVEAGD